MSKEKLNIMTIKCQWVRSGLWKNGRRDKSWRGVRKIPCRKM